jgi:hypothetical protein
LNEVVIDGVRYIPETAPVGPTGPSIGVGITTCDPSPSRLEAITKIAQLAPGPVVLVDDASRVPVSAAEYRFVQNVGIAAAKNKALELLYDQGVEHFFLFDDDAYPLTENWWVPYVQSPEPHLMYVFQEFAGAGAPRLNDCKVLRVEDDLVAYSTPRGVMLYATREVLDVAGGMDPGFGKWGYEHGDWSNRIHSFGLTSFRYADVKDSSELIYSLDEHVHENGGHQRSVPTTERKANLAPNKERHDRQYNKAIRYEFRQPRDVVLTAYLTGARDPQRQQNWKPDPKALDPLVNSLIKRMSPADIVVFSNEIEAEGAWNVRVGPPQSPYFDRWLHFYRWLRDHPEVRFVWCVDSTDVVSLAPPFDLEPGVLYVGSEHNLVGMDWMRKNGEQYAEWIEAHKDEQLLNCGLIGGERAVVMAVLHDLVREYYDFLGAGKPLTLDMAPFNYVVRRYPYVTGPRVHTVFRANDHKSKTAMWAHK